MLVLVLILLAGVTGAFLQGKRAALAREEANLDRTSEEHRYFLGLEVGRSLLVPEVLATSKSVRALLLQPNETSIREQNEILEETARNVQVDVVYVMDLGGNTLAASNWRDADSFVGRNYGFRPYFKQALAGRTGRYIAKGITSLKIGYYVARPVLIDGRIQGVLAVKISLDQIQSRVEQLWRRAGEIVLIADEHGVVSVSPWAALMFKTVRPIAEAERKAVEASRQYGEEIAQAALILRDSLSEGIRFVEFTDLPNQSFLRKSYHFEDIDVWLYLHVPASRYWAIVAEFTGMFSLLALGIQREAGGNRDS